MCIMHFAISLLRICLTKFYSRIFVCNTIGAIQMLFSPCCREFNSLQKRYIALLHRTNTFSENKIIRSVVGGKVDGQILFGIRSEKPKILFGARDQKRKNLFGAKLQLRKILLGSQRVKSDEKKTRFTTETAVTYIFILFLY